MTRKEQKFGVGDIAILKSPKIGEAGFHFYKVKIIECSLDERGEWWYEVQAIDIQPPFSLVTREVPQEALTENLSE